MKKRILFVLSALFLGGLTTGCEWGVMSDPPGYSYYVWVNESDHQITFLETEHLQPGERIERELTGGIVHTPFPSEFFGRISAEVVFDEETYKVMYGWPGTPSENQMPSMNYDKPYNPTWDDNYVQEDVKSPHGCKKCPGRRWTYTFTNADYDAAVAYVKAQEEQAKEAK